MVNKKRFTETITSLNSQGQGVCSLDGLKIFVDEALPGEVIHGEIVIQKKNFGQGKIISVQNPSLERTSPICPVFHQCGGCQIMHMSYPLQLEFKTNKVKEALGRIAHIDFNPSHCIASPSPLYYRNKIQLPFFEKEGKLKLGLYQKQSNTPIEISKCYIHCELGEKVFHTINALLPDYSLSVYDEQAKSGTLRHLLIRTTLATNEVLIVFIAASKKERHILAKLGEKIMQVHPEVKGVVLNINTKRFNSIAGDEYITLCGRPFIFERLFELTFKISAHSFFQVNLEQAENLYQTALEWAQIEPHHHVLDAYCGIGSLSLFIAKNAKSVTGIEVVSSAIDDAIMNARENNIFNCSFILGTVEEKIQSLPHFDIVFLNPPRKGCDLKVIEAMIASKPSSIIYVSCDPATLSRDLALLCKGGYSLEKVQPFDMFPQTEHVETLALLKLC